MSPRVVKVGFSSTHTTQSNHNEMNHCATVQVHGEKYICLTQMGEAGDVKTEQESTAEKQKKKKNIQKRKEVKSTIHSLRIANAWISSISTGSFLFHEHMDSFNRVIHN